MSEPNLAPPELFGCSECGYGVRESELHHVEPDDEGYCEACYKHPWFPRNTRRRLMLEALTTLDRASFTVSYLPGGPEQRDWDGNIEEPETPSYWTCSVAAPMDFYEGTSQDGPEEALLALLDQLADWADDDTLIGNLWIVDENEGPEPEMVDRVEQQLASDEQVNLWTDIQDQWKTWLTCPECKEPGMLCQICGGELGLTHTEALHRWYSDIYKREMWI